MQITMQRQDIIPLPTITETYVQAIDELMDDISLVRTSIFSHQRPCGTPS